MEGRLLKDSTGNNTDDINYIPIMNKDKLIAGYHHIMKTIYEPKNYYKRIRTFITYYRPKSKNHFNLRLINAAIKSIWSIGFISKKRWFYWHLLIASLFTNIRAIPIVIELTIVGLHFEKVAADICDQN